jgi:hypothetical protein
VGTIIDAIQFDKYSLYLAMHVGLDYTYGSLALDVESTSVYTVITDQLIPGQTARYMHLDNRKLQYIGESHVFTIPVGYPWDDNNTVIYEAQSVFFPAPGTLLAWSRDGENITLLDATPGEKLVVFGTEFTSTFAPSQKWVRDDMNKPLSYAKLRITDYSAWTKGDEVSAELTPRANTLQTWPIQTFNNATATPDNVEPQEEVFNRISFKQRPKDVRLTLTANGPYGLTIRQIEWRGTYFKAGRNI